MLFKYTTLPIFGIILGTSFSLTAMDGGQKSDQLTQTLRGTRGNQEVDESLGKPHTTKTTSYAFASNLPQDVTLRSDYIKNRESQHQCIASLTTLNLIEKTTVKGVGKNTETTTDHELDARELDALYRVGVLEVERPKL